METTDLKEKQKETTKEWDEMADTWDEIAVSYRDSLVAQLWDLLEIDESSRKDLTVLDFGCGSGLLTEKLREQVKRVVSIDASPSMMEKVEEKIAQRNWENVEAHTAVLSEVDSQPDSVRKALEELKGEIDLIVASSVLSFIPDLDGTMKTLRDLLKPGTGILCHTDWPLDIEKAPTGFTEEKGLKMFEEAGLKKMTIKTIQIHMVLGPGEEGNFPVFFGAAAKP